MLEIKDFKIEYGNKLIFKELNLVANKGEIILITGPSGCGKSSLLKVINGIIPEVEQAKLSGKIMYNNVELDQSISKRSQIISTVFQNPKTQFYCINTTDELAFGLENRNIPKEKIFEIIDEYTNLLNTKDLLGKNIFTLSGGQKQLIAITATSAMNNDIYLLDEPSSSLDRTSVTWLKETLVKLKEMGKIILIAEHRLYYLKNLIDKICILDMNESKTFDKNELTDEFLEEIREKYNLRTWKDYARNPTKPNKVIHLLEKNSEISGKLQCREIKFSYNDNQIINTSVAFDKGINFIVGENGIGKSIFIKILANLLKHAGHVYYDEHEIIKSYDYISMVMQDVNYQLFTDSVWQEISIASNDDSLKKKILKELDLYDKKENHPQTLSGGEKQRLLIGLAKVSNKPIVILDEPTSGLCKSQMTQMINYLWEMRDQGKLVIVITHDYELIHECGGRIYQFIK